MLGPRSASRRPLVGVSVPDELQALEREAVVHLVDLLPPRSVLGKSTVEAIRSGVIFGFASQVDGMLARLREELGDETEAIATGGLANTIVPYCDSIDDIDQMLTLTGLRLVYERNAPPH